MDFEMLFKVANEAKENAYAPYSNFKVGAALLSKTGKIYSGCNIENASYSLTCCAERVAIFKAISQGETEFDTFIITSNTKAPIAPCGACRQVMNEFFDENVTIVLTNQTNKRKELSIKQLLPYAFDL
ncbi:MAG TPA: cytidine deaminase [Pseudogracilibacillus sp.]|nr:cytidine deaminase [Pseudogracilibacillus sp.]